MAALSWKTQSGSMTPPLFQPFVRGAGSMGHKAGGHRGRDTNPFTGIKSEASLLGTPTH